MANDFSAELGFSLRSGDDVKEAFGMSVGVNWTIPSAKAKQPKLYANIAYNLDPYSTGSTDADLTDYLLENSSEGETAIRFGIVWDY